MGGELDGTLAWRDGPVGGRHIGSGHSRKQFGRHWDLVSGEHFKTEFIARNQRNGRGRPWGGRGHSRGGQGGGLDVGVGRDVESQNE